MATIVIIDDSPANSLPLSRLLQYQGHEVDCILRSNVALDAIRHDKPDLVLLDVSMPDLNGIELLRLIRQQADIRDTPVVMYSAMSDPKVKQEATDLGARDYLIKGGGWEPLLDRIEELLQN